MDGVVLPELGTAAGLGCWSPPEGCCVSLCARTLARTNIRNSSKASNRKVRKLFSSGNNNRVARFQHNVLVYAFTLKQLLVRHGNLGLFTVLGA
jgi:hypothetical protein